MALLPKTIESLGRPPGSASAPPLHRLTHNSDLCNSDCHNRPTIDRNIFRSIVWHAHVSFRRYRHSLLADLDLWLMYFDCLTLRRLRSSHSIGLCFRLAVASMLPSNTLCQCRRPIRYRFRPPIIVPVTTILQKICEQYNTQGDASRRIFAEWMLCLRYSYYFKNIRMNERRALWIFRVVKPLCLRWKQLSLTVDWMCFFSLLLIY